MLAVDERTKKGTLVAGIFSGDIMDKRPRKIISVRFFQTEAGNEPVKSWLSKLEKEDKASIGADIKEVEYGWPLGMPLVKKMGDRLWEVRSTISDKRIARVLFTVCRSTMVLLHGFVKKSQKTPSSDLDLAKSRRDAVHKED